MQNAENSASYKLSAQAVRGIAAATFVAMITVGTMTMRRRKRRIRSEREHCLLSEVHHLSTCASPTCCDSPGLSFPNRTQLPSPKHW